MTELVDYRYFMQKTGFSNTVKAKHILASRLEKQALNKAVVQYYKTDMDKLVEEYNIRFEPIKPNELTIFKLAEHFKRSPDYIAKVARHPDFPQPSRLYQERGSRKPFRVWLMEDIDGLALEDFYSQGYEKVEREPFSWSGLQAEFIRLCRPGGLLVNDRGFGI